MDKLSLRVLDIETDEGYMNELLKEVEEKIGTIPKVLLEAVNGDPIENSDATVPFNGMLSVCQRSGGSHSPGTQHNCTDDREQTGVAANNDGCLGQTPQNGKFEHRAPTYGFPEGIDSKLLRLKSDLMALRKMDAKLMLQLLAINDEIEELKWINENMDFASSKESLSSSRESMHEKWVEMRSLAALNSSRESLVSSRLSLTREGSRRKLRFNNHNGLLSKYSGINGKDDCAPPTADYLRGRRGSSGELLKTSPPVITIGKRRRSSLTSCSSPIDKLPPTNNNLLYEIEITNDDITQL
ncbi:uncharacterized protein LOC144436331 [Glandiceps talaboti]